MRPILPLAVVGILACAGRNAIEPPTPSLTTPLPAYPVMLREASVAGAVSIAVPVSAEGVALTRMAKVVASSHDLFLLSVKRAVDSWRFQPGRRDGTAQVDTVLIHFAFKLDSSAHCGPSVITVRPGEQEPARPTQPPATATFDPQMLSGTITACRPATVAHIVY